MSLGQCSQTFRGLEAEIEASDLIVYIQVRRFTASRFAGGLQFVASTAQARILRVVLDTTVDRNRVVATLGHELQHALEVARAPSIRTSAAFDGFYLGQGLRTAEHERDTDPARQAGDMIRKEIAGRVECNRQGKGGL